MRGGIGRGVDKEKEAVGMKERACAIVNGYLVRLKEMTNSEILAALEKAQEDSQDSKMLERDEP